MASLCVVRALLQERCRNILHPVCRFLWYSQHSQTRYRRTYVESAGQSSVHSKEGSGPFEADQHVLTMERLCEARAATMRNPAVVDSGSEGSVRTDDGDPRSASTQIAIEHKSQSVDVVSCEKHDCGALRTTGRRVGKRNGSIAQVQREDTVFEGRLTDNVVIRASEAARAKSNASDISRRSHNTYDFVSALPGRRHKLDDPSKSERNASRNKKPSAYVARQPDVDMRTHFPPMSKETSRVADAFVDEENCDDIEEQAAPRSLGFFVMGGARWKQDRDMRKQAARARRANDFEDLEDIGRKGKGHGKGKRGNQSFRGGKGRHLW